MYWILYFFLFPALTFSHQAESWLFDFDPHKIIVEDPNVTLLAELPSGDYHLKEYRAGEREMLLFSKNHKIQEPLKKDNPKAPQCTRSEVEALRLWGTNEVYQRVNEVLRIAQKGKLPNTTITERLENEILMIASGVNCAPQFVGEVVRGERAPHDILLQYQPGNWVGLRGFTSTTKGTALAETFSPRVIQKIKIPNARGADIDSLGIAQWPVEKEVLIRPGTVFKVLSRKEITPIKYLNLELVFEQY